MRLLYSFLLFFMSLSLSMAQVGINTQNPNKLTELEVTNVINGADTIPKGVMIPRMSESLRNQIDVSDINTSNSLMIYNTNEDCYNYYSKTEKKWQSLCGKVGNADFEISDCSKIRVYGTYQNDIALTSANYIIIPVKVDKPGSYTITVIPNPENGYYFNVSSEFLTAGSFEVVVPGAGTPMNFTPAGSDGDEIDLKLNRIDFTCTNKPKIKIEDSTVRPFFGISCNSVTVQGVYKREVDLTTDNKITMRINVSEGSQGAEYIVETDVIDGLSFKGSGVLGVAGSQEITLYAEGSVHGTAPKYFTIKTNSESTTATCNAYVVPVISQKKIVEFAYNSGLSYGLASGGNWGCQAMLNDNMNYGDNVNSIIKYMGFSTITHVNALYVTAAQLRTNAGIGSSQPADIILFTYDTYPYNTEAIDLLVDYVNKGGILIYMDQKSYPQHQELLTKMFGETVSASNMTNIAATANYIIKMNSSVNDDVINGPFGDTRTYQWGDDLGNTLGLTFIPRDAIVYAGSIAADTNEISSTGVQVSVMRHKTKNFFWFGDSGFIASGGENFTGQTSNPFRIASYTINGNTYPKYPATKPHGYNAYSGGNLSIPDCNSIFFANLMAWALNEAEESGINAGK